MKKINSILIMSVTIMSFALIFTACNTESGTQNSMEIPTSTKDNVTTEAFTTDDPMIDINESDGLEFKLNDNKQSYSLVGIGTCNDTEIIIPHNYNGLPVTSIGDGAFWGCSKITSVIIPNSVQIIGDMAF